MYKAKAGQPVRHPTVAFHDINKEIDGKPISSPVELEPKSDSEDEAENDMDFVVGEDRFELDDDVDLDSSILVGMLADSAVGADNVGRVSGDAPVHSQKAHTAEEEVVDWDW
ncbi:hypothetical protein DXG01_009198 [Tephrocybe rancida]|nr:hypothetical protein DXG01_009198 [Tephrocybe rancida]